MAQLDIVPFDPEPSNERAKIPYQPCGFFFPTAYALRTPCQCWGPGDALVRDERAILHLGAPWPCDQARTLVSCCISTSSTDGLSVTRP